MGSVISITSAKHINGYKIALKFNDGKENVVDFENFITHSQHPDIQKYRNVALFKNFNLEFGDLEWNDYELTFPVFDLYQGHITTRH
jgi:hypothetical protein